MMRNLLLASVVLLGLQGQGGPQQGSLRVGDAAPLFKLKVLAKKESFALASNFGKRPTFLVFGSYT